MGELRDSRKAVLPIVAAPGGMIVPMGIYLLLQRGQPGQSGWGIPVAASLGSPVAIAVVAGLVIGKPIGIVLFSWIATKPGFARLPSGVNWKILLGAGCLAGIGFTISIFIAGLALQGDLLDDGKIGTLVGSTISALPGCVLLLMLMPKGPVAPVGADEQQFGDTEIPATRVSEKMDRAGCDDRWRDDGGQVGFDKE